MLSRVADAIYWMNRYIERAENVARFIEVNLNLMLDLPPGSGEQWEPLVITSGDSEDFKARYPGASREEVMRFLTFDPLNPNSILSCLRSARENARSIREIISSEMWEQVNKFYLMVNDASAAAVAMDSPHDFYTAVKSASHTFEGITMTTLTRGEGFHFSRLGRMLERADKTSRILDVKYYILLPVVGDVGSPYDNIQWAAVLQSASALEMYRKMHHRIHPERVVEFLLLDRDFPRAIHYSVIRAQDSLHAISGTPAGCFNNEAERQLGRLRSELSYSQVNDVIKGGLHEFLDEFQERLNVVGAAIHDTFFAIRPLAVNGAIR